MENRDKSENHEMSIQEIYEAVLDLSRKINDIHRLHFPEQQLVKGKNQKQKFLAEILTSSARNSKKG